MQPRCAVPRMSKPYAFAKASAPSFAPINQGAPKCYNSQERTAVGLALRFCRSFSEGAWQPMESEASVCRSSFKRQCGQYSQYRKKIKGTEVFLASTVLIHYMRN